MYDLENNKLNGIAEVCHPCIIKQARSAAAFAKLDDHHAEDIVRFAENSIEESKRKPIVVQHIVRRVADEIISKLGENDDHDIYFDVKKLSNDLALKYAGEFRKKVSSASSPVEAGLKLAAAGNIIDFGAKSLGSINIEEELKKLEETKFERYDIESFKFNLKNAENMLYLLDNSGEIVFDMMFIEELQKVYPDLEITAALREKPIINDATLEDAGYIGLDKKVKCISSGSVYPGTILDETNDEFMKYYNSADVILSKGQGNFETLLPEAEERLFFLLRIKCDYMAELSGVEKNNLVLMQGNTDLRTKKTC